MSGVRHESVSYASRTVVCFAEQNALLCGEDVSLCMCGCIRVVFDKNNMPALIAFFCNDKTIIRIVGELCLAVFRRCEWLRALSVGVLL